MIAAESAVGGRETQRGAKMFFTSLRSPAMTTITIEITAAQERALKARTGQRTAKAAVQALIDGPADYTLNAATRRSVESKSTRGDKMFANGRDGVAYLRKKFG